MPARPYNLPKGSNQKSFKAGSPSLFQCWKWFETKRFYLLTPFVHARIHYVHGPVTNQGGLKSQKFQSPPILTLPCYHARKNPLRARPCNSPKRAQITKVPKAVPPPYNVKNDPKPKNEHLTLLWLRARKNSLCAHYVHGSVTRQGGLKSQKFQR